MTGPAPAAAIPSPTDPARSPAGGGHDIGPVAVVWCRQVDNEAESPGYTTVPEEFPGRAETLDLIRLVGNLTINVADTHDYWTPGPPAQLAYYPNLFLYPAFGGRYTCVGRMFLSTEDRPRLGMKTLVLDTSQLLASGEFGAAILRWHGTMAGGRGDGRRPAVPDPALYGLLGEGLLFHRGTTDPVVVVASHEWESAMEVLFDMVRVLPASLLQLGAILAFPYFLPQPKTNLHEFAEQIPLALALMRIPMAEAMGDRHRKRLQSWESTDTTFRDLTSGVPAPAKGKENLPLVLQYVRDRNAAKLSRLVQRVDLVELPKLRALLSDPERQSGKERRKEMWRIGTAMESAALLLQRGRGRHVPVNLETAKRAQEYLRAEPPRADPEEPTESAVVPPASGWSRSPAAPAPAAGHPSWLARGSDLPPPPTAGPEAVPISVSEDPSLAPPPSAPVAPGSAPAAPPAPAEPAARAAAPPALDERFRRMEEELLHRLATEIQQAVGGEVDRRIDPAVDAKLRTLLQGTETRLAQTLTELDTRYQERFQKLGGTAGAAAVPSAEAIRGLEVGLADRIRTEVAAALAAQPPSPPAADGGTEARWQEFEARATEQWTGLLAATESRLRESLPALLATEIDRRLRASLERELADPVRGGEPGLLARRMDRRIDETVRLAVQGAEARYERSREELEHRWEERARSYKTVGSPLSPKELESLPPLLDAHRSALQEEFHQALETKTREIADLESAERAALAAMAAQQIRDAINLEVEARAESEGRLRQAIETRLLEGEQRRPKELREMETRLTALVEARGKEGQSRILAAARDVEGRLRTAADERAAQSEARFSAALEARAAEIAESQAHADADLQVRLQSYTDQKLREAEDHLRGTTVELMARLRSEVEGTLAKGPDLQRIEPVLKDRLTRAGETIRSEIRLGVDRQIHDMEERLATEQTEALQKLELLERDIREQTGALLKVEESMRGELDDLDRRLITLADRLLPVVRKTWLRLAEMERNPGSPADIESRLVQLRREFKDEFRRIDSDVANRARDLRDRMETTVAHQGKIWLTLVHSLQQLTEERRGTNGAALSAILQEEEAPVPDPPDEETAPPTEPLGRNVPTHRSRRRAGRDG